MTDKNTVNAVDFKGAVFEGPVRLSASYTTEPRNQFRWAVLAQTTTEPPRLQQAHYRYDTMTLEWVDVPRVVVDSFR